MDTSRGKLLDDAPGVIGLAPGELPPLPDDLLTNRDGARIDPRRWFAHPDRPFEIEIGCGKGGFILQHALAHGELNILGIEIAKEFYFYTADRLRRRALTNVRMLCADAGDFLVWRCPPAIVRTLHLYYSDPWPKNKHHKNRVVQHRFLSEAWRVLMPGGELRIVTDHDELWQWCEQHIAPWTSAALAHAPSSPVPEFIRAALPAASPFERDAFSPPTWVEEGETVGTNYERKFTGDSAGGKQPHACVLRKPAHLPG
jgi:tRNA (guanine-N7-)-methyltransferase